MFSEALRTLQTDRRTDVQTDRPDPDTDVQRIVANAIPKPSRSGHDATRVIDPKLAHLNRAATNRFFDCISERPLWVTLSGLEDGQQFPSRLDQASPATSNGLSRLEASQSTLGPS